jgi:hypothetical protein
MTRPGMTRPGLPTRPNPRVGDARRLAFPALPKLETRHSIVDQHRELVLRNMPASTALPVTLSRSILKRLGDVSYILFLEVLSAFGASPHMTRKVLQRGGPWQTGKTRNHYATGSLTLR